MLSKRNYQERIRQMVPKKEHFSIRKFSVGAASVLIGFTFVSMAGSHKVQAADVADKSVVVDTFNKDKSQELTENKTIAMPKAEKTAVSSVVQKGASANKIEAENTTQVDKNTEGSVKVQENKDAVQPKTVNNENVLNVSKAQSQSNEAVTKNAAESKVQVFAALRAFRAAPQATQSQDASDFQSLVNAMNDSSIGTINITNDITITGKVNGLTTSGISDINKHYLYLQSEGSARDLTINGNGHTINFAGYSIALQNKNYTNAANSWNITLKDMTIEGSKYDYSPISFCGSKSNTENSKLTFDGVTANLNDRPLVDKYGENLPVHFAGENNITLNNMSIGYNLVTGKTVKFDSGNTTFNVNGKVTGRSINPNNWVIRSTEDASTSENPSTLINEGATVTINAKSDDLRGIYAGRQLTAGQPIYGVTVINGTLNANMAAGHSTAIWSHDLEIGKKGNVTIHTKQTNQADGVENGTSNSVTNYNGTHYAPISLGVGPISSAASPLSKQTVSLINNGSLTIIRDTAKKTLVPLISMGDGGLSSNTTLKFSVGAGATLDLQDKAGTFRYGTEPSTPLNGLVTLWGTSGTDLLEFLTPAYVNLQRTGDIRGTLIRMEGVYNSTTVNGPTPVAQWDQGNKTTTPNDVWYVRYLISANQWGNNSGQFMGKDQHPNTVVAKKGVDTLYNSNATVLMSKNQGADKYENGTMPTEVQQALHLNSFLNNFNFWRPQRMAMGSKLNDNPDVKIDDFDKHQDHLMFDGTTRQTLSDLDANKGLKDLIGPDEQPITDFKDIVKHVTWYNSATDKDEWNKIMIQPTDSKDPSARVPYPEPQNPTGNLKTTDGFAWAKVTYADGSVDFVKIPLKVTEKKYSEELTPSYPGVSVEQGKSDSVDPSFKDENDKAADAPAGTKYTAGENTPDWIKVDPDTGKVTVSPTDDTSVGSHDISVTVTYPDSSTDQLTVPVTVTEKSNLAEKYPVSYDKLNVEKPSGDTPATGAVDPKAAADMPEGAITGYEKGDFDAPAGVTIDVNHDTGKVTASVGKNATLGSFEVPVKVTYSDGTYAEVKVPVSITGNKVDPGSGDVVYYGDQSMVVFNGNLTTVHKTTDSHELSAKDSAFQTITYYSDWNKKGNIVSDYNKHVIYKLSADGTKYVNEADATDSFDASAISFNWQKGYEVNTGVDNFSNGSADTLYQLEKGAVNSEEQTDANDPSGLAGNSKYRYDFSISDTNVLQKLGLSPAGYNAWANVYYNFLGATGKINIPVNYGSEVSTDEAGIKNYLATNSISGKTFVNGNPTGIKWAENGMPGKDGKFAASNMTGIVEFTFDNGTKLNVQVTFKTGSHVPTSGSKVNDDTNLYVERTIEYDVTGTGHSPINSVTQKVHYVRDGYHKINADGTDAGEIIWNEWKLADGQTAEFPEYSVDQITGYDAYINGAKATQVDAAKVAETNGTPQNGQNITVTYKKQNSTPVPYKPGKDGVNDAINRYVTRTIIVKEPGKEPQTITQTVHFTNEDKDGNSGYKDPVTGEIKYNTDWHVASDLNAKTGSWEEYTAPSVTGYTPSQAKVEAKTVTAETEAASVTISYTKNADIPVPFDPSNKDMYREVTRTINVVDPITGKISTSVQTAKFTREDKNSNAGYTDPVTGKTTMNPWTPAKQGLRAVNVEQIKGYVAKVDGNVDAVVVTPDSANMVVTITYQANKPEGQNITVKKDTVPDPADGIKNKDDLPDGTKYTWKEVPDTTTPGEKSTTVVVTYPDGKKVEVPVTVTVTDTTPDADKYTPEGQDVHTKPGTVPDPADGIKNKGDLPDGTKYTWEKTPDVSKPGTTTATVVVTYPDGSKDKVEVHVVVDNPTPEPQDVHTTPGVVPNPSTAIKNKDEMPDGTKYTWKEVPDVNSVGEKTGIVTVTFPDGTSVDVKVTVYVDPVVESNRDTLSKEANTGNTNVAKAATVTSSKVESKKTLPQTGSKTEQVGILGLAIATVGSLLGLGVNRKKRQK
ncbi:Rib/alpha-like domain-containing protein [Lactobacillus jensenii]|uniref:Rib/alpha-like domain-containing protein n=1 Tax=Lactobacillus jensenii TaxID=109790 RepID=UPI0029C1B323|nr:Rib/alpha-like domain-containing protein [Lactobacillus jensenii]MDX5076041.1 Rib/alpha-like domain-containing protein [Lactobacillus jensenii]MDX5094884.1 Rib/alpha-like domain-containing protein [Lactobacillus jensenii]MDX5111903.1 Rib/alpha-like domain-containing protein [Lactobacillus jensenii]